MHFTFGWFQRTSCQATALYLTGREWFWVGSGLIVSDEIRKWLYIPRNKALIMKCFVLMEGFEDESLESTTPPPPEIEAPPPSVSTPPPLLPPPATSATPPPMDPRNSTRNSGTGGSANLNHLAAQLLLLLPLLAFFWLTKVRFLLVWPFMFI